MGDFMVDKIDQYTANLDEFTNDLVPQRNKSIEEKIIDGAIGNQVKIGVGAVAAGADIAAHGANIALTPFDKIAKGVEATAAPLVNSLGRNMPPYEASKSTKHEHTGVVFGAVADGVGSAGEEIDKLNAKLSNLKTGSKIGDVATALTVKPAGTIILKTVEGVTYVASEALHVAGVVEGGVEKIGTGIVHTVSPADNKRAKKGAEEYKTEVAENTKAFEVRHAKFEHDQNVRAAGKTGMSKEQLNNVVGAKNTWNDIFSKADVQSDLNQLSGTEYTKAVEQMIGSKHIDGRIDKDELKKFEQWSKDNNLDADRNGDGKKDRHDLGNLTPDELRTVVAIAEQQRGK
jgi:hypothetical protein